MSRRSALLVTVLVLLAGLGLPADSPGPSTRYPTNTAPGLIADEAQGTSVAAFGDIVAVGAPRATGLHADTGVVRLFTRSDLGWALTQTVQAADGQAGDRFGTSVALSEDYLAVGAPAASYEGSATGAVYVYRRDTGSGLWTFLHKIKGDNSVVGDRFGTSVALDVYRLVVGADSYAGGTGAAYVFEPSGDVFGQTAFLTVWGRIFLGRSVTTGWGRIVVGAPGIDSLVGTVDVWVHDGTTWIHEATLTGSDTETADRFGSSVSLYGDVIVAGSPLDDVGGVANAGSAFVFLFGTAWTEFAHLMPPTPGANANFGASVAASGDLGTILVGEPFGAIGGQVHQFTFAQPPYRAAVYEAAPGIESSWKFGASLAVPLGFSDDHDRIVVGAPWAAPTPGVASGAAFLINPLPIVQEVTPATGPTDGGTTATVSGLGFSIDAGMRVWIDGTECTVSNATPSSFTFETPAHDAGTVDIFVRHEGNQQGVLVPGAFTYAIPLSITSVIPHFGSPAGGTTVTIVGTGFEDGATIRFGAASATGVTFVSETTLTGLAPAGASGVVDVTVTNPDTTETMLAGGFQYTDADLLVAQFNAPPGVGIGEAFNVTDTTRNARPGTTPETTTAFFIQPNVGGSAAPDPKAPAIAIGQRNVPAFAGRGANGATTSVMVPPGTTPGVYTLYAQADFDQDVGELKELNNLKSRRLVVGGDLQAMPLRAPMAGRIGLPVTITVKTKNNGPGTAPPGTITRLLLSTDTVPDIGDMPLTEWKLNAIAARETVSSTFVWTVDVGLTPGRYYLLTIVDQAGVWAELNEENNTKAKAFTVR